MRFLSTLFLWLIVSTLTSYAQSGCQTPSVYLNNVDHQSALVNIYTSSGATGYQIQWRPVNTPAWSGPLSLTTSGITNLTGLINNTTYEYRTRSICQPGDTSAYTALQTFQTICRAPYFASTGTILFNGATLNWSGQAPNGTPHELQYRPANTINWTSIAPTTASPYSLTGLNTDVVFEWRMRAVCSTTATSAFVDGNVFRTSCQPPQSPNTREVYHNRAQLNWSTSQPDVQYEVLWRPANVTPWNSLTVVNTNTVPLTGLANNTRYEWRIRSVCSAQVASDFTTTQSFQTQCVPPNTSTQRVNASSAQLSFNTSVPEATYVVQWKPATATNWNSVSVTTGNAYSLQNLALNTSYNWRVQSVCSATESSSFVDGTTFQTVCNPPASYGQYASTTDTEATLSWPNDELNVQYAVRWREQNSSFWNTISGLTQTTYRIVNLQTIRPYEWQVQRVCSPGDPNGWSAFSSVNTFQAFCNKPSYPYTPSIQSSVVTLRWDGSATSFVLQYRPQGTPTWTTVSSITATSYELGGLAAQTTYEWQVRASCAPDVSASYLTGSTFRLLCPAVSEPWVELPTQTTARLSWGLGGDGRYDVQWRPQSNTGTWTSIENLLGTSTLLENLTPNSSYECRVRGRCANGSVSDYSNTRVFTTHCQEPSTLTVRYTSFSLVRLQWFAPNTTDTYSLLFREAGTSNWGEQTGITQPSVTMAGLTYGKQYEWMVRRECGATTSGYMGGPLVNATCPPVPSLVQQTPILPDRATVSWAPVQYDNVQYNVQWRLAGATPWNTLGGLVEPTASLTGLTNETQYQWRVQTVCPVGSTIVGVESYTTTLRTSCEDWNLGYSARVSDVSHTSAQLSWKVPTRPELTTFDMFVCANPYSGAPACQTLTNVTGNSYSLTGLTPNTYFEWRIRHRCADGTYGAYRLGGSFSTGCSPAYFGSQVVTTTQARLDWWASAEATVEILWRRDEGSDWTTIAPTNTTSYTFTNLQPATNYTFQIRSMCTDGQWSAYSTRTLRTEISPLTPPNISSLRALAGNTSAQLSWSVVATPASFAIYYKSALSTVWQVITGHTSTSLTLSGLQPRTPYDWAVMAVQAGAGVPTEPSGLAVLGSFRTECSAYSVPMLRMVRGGEADFNTFVPFGASYLPMVDLQWREVGATDWQSRAFGTTDFTLTGLIPQTVYEYRARPQCFDGSFAAFVSNGRFVTQCPDILPQPYAPNAGVGLTEALLSWNTGSFSVGVLYELQWRKAPGQPGGTDQWTNLSSLTTTTYSLTNLAANARYEWRVRSLCPAGVGGAFSPIWSFRTQCLPPLNLMNGAVSGTSVPISWAPDPGKANFIVNYRPLGATTSQVLITPQSSVTLTNLVTNKTYTYQVQRQCDAQIVSEPAFGQSFKAICFPSAGFSQIRLEPAGPNAMSINLSAANASQYRIQYREIGSATWQQTPVFATSIYTITGLKPNTTYDANLLYGCDADIPTQIRSVDVGRTIPDPSAMYTLKTGYWTDPRIWSGNRIPVATDPIRVRHAVQVPSRFTGVTGPMQLEVGGQLRFETAAGLKTGN